MAYEFQVTQDSADPHALADWWAETLGWEVEATDETFIRRMISEGHATEADTRTHKGVLVWRDGAAIRHEGRPRVQFQLVPEKKAAKNRMHLDLRIGDDDVWWGGLRGGSGCGAAHHKVGGRSGRLWGWFELEGPVIAQ